MSPGTCVPEESTAQVWSLSANDMMDDDVDLIDDDDLLDEDDLKKPDPASLRGKQHHQCVYKYHSWTSTHPSLPTEYTAVSQIQLRYNSVMKDMSVMISNRQLLEMWCLGTEIRCSRFWSNSWRNRL